MSAACPKFDMVAISLAYPSGEEWGNFLVQIMSTCLSYAGGGGGRHPVDSALQDYNIISFEG